MATLINGKKIAQELKNKIILQVQQMEQRPGLAVILVGSDPASKIYVENKEEACQAVGFYSKKIVLSKDTSQEMLIKEIKKLNHDPKIHGILVQMPLPKHLSQDQIIQAIDPSKDVDCLHPLNMGQMMALKELPALDQLLTPCTPKGILKLIKSTNVTIAGKKAVVIGRSQLVGKPISLMLLAEDATVTMAHSRTQDLAKACQQADILVVAVGHLNLITQEMVKPRSIVIDVGINRLNGQVVGDIEFESVKQVAGFITPVPGGVGPMTIACLLENTLILKNKQFL
jgi:methylenetetrahydrofolate dehydrogenase (NADP+)/methenyltetrahydrofolate cyclohydrolase